MDIEQRKALTFEQAEGRAPLPSQLSVGEVSPSLRARLWLIIHQWLTSGDQEYVGSFVRQVLLAEWVERQHGFVDEFPEETDTHVALLGAIFKTGDYVDIFGFLQFFIRHPKSGGYAAFGVRNALIETGAAYRLLDSTIVPISSEENAVAVSRDLQAVAAAGLPSASSHLRKAASALSQGGFADSVRESIHAVDAAARRLAPGTRDLGPALTALAEKGYIHPAMKSGFSSLYGYASDEKGVRHALLDGGDAKVSEADAMFMFGACAAFCAYLVTKGREVGAI